MFIGDQPSCESRGTQLQLLAIDSLVALSDERTVLNPIRWYTPTLSDVKNFKLQHTPCKPPTHADLWRLAVPELLTCCTSFICRLRILSDLPASIESIPLTLPWFNNHSTPMSDGSVWLRGSQRSSWGDCQQLALNALALIAWKDPFGQPLPEDNGFGTL